LGILARIFVKDPGQQPTSAEVSFAAMLLGTMDHDGPELEERDRTLCRLFVASVLGLWDEVRRLRLAAVPGEPDRRWREAILQIHVFAGFPRLVETYNVLGRAGGLGQPEPDEERSTLGASTDAELTFDEHTRGRELFERIYTEHAGRVRGVIEGYHTDFADWLEGHAYGRVLARPGLAGDRRELLAVAALAALGQDRQLASHARGALRLGATRAELTGALDAVADLIRPERVQSARVVVEHFH
jgi:alkylhydroperoxidase/carboxymuconolactone decarboxylase family protein YurZ